MLDLNHPMTQHRFAAARGDDRLLTLAKLMTLASTKERQRLLGFCDEPVNSLRLLNEKYFGAWSFIAEAITELEGALNGLAALKTNPPDGTVYAITACPICSTPLTRCHAPFMPQPERRWSVYCNACLKAIGPVRQNLVGADGFGTWAI